jgi:catechol 2,3-dioxygenase-like lactoylglutathione lyase family enzyme
VAALTRRATVFTYVCLGTSDPERAARFYDAVLGTLGHRRCEAGADWDAAGWRGWGTYERHGTTELALWLCLPFDGRPASAGNGTMVAFSARSWKEVEEFHAQALAHGGASEGAPGLRPQYTPDFYAAYVRDPDGNKLSAVCRGFTEPQER